MPLHELFSKLFLLFLLLVKMKRALYRNGRDEIINKSLVIVSPNRSILRNVNINTTTTTTTTTTTGAIVVLRRNFGTNNWFAHAVLRNLNTTRDNSFSDGNNRNSDNREKRVISSSSSMLSFSTSSSNNASSSVVSGDDKIEFTEKCERQLRKISEREGERKSLRIGVDGGGCAGFQYTFKLINDREIVDTEDRVFRGRVFEDVKIVCDETSFEYLKGSTIDYVEEMIRSAFEVVKNPNAEAKCGCGVSFEAKF